MVFLVSNFAIFFSFPRRWSPASTEKQEEHFCSFCFCIITFCVVFYSVCICLSPSDGWQGLLLRYFLAGIKKQAPALKMPVFYRCLNSSFSTPPDTTAHRTFSDWQTPGTRKSPSTPRCDRFRPQAFPSSNHIRPGRIPCQRKCGTILLHIPNR